MPGLHTALVALEAALVDGHHPVPGIGQRGDLVAPRVPRLGETVHQDHERSLARLDAVHARAGDIDHVRPAPRRERWIRHADRMSIAFIRERVVPSSPTHVTPPRPTGADVL